MLTIYVLFLFLIIQICLDSGKIDDSILTDIRWHKEFQIINNTTEESLLHLKQ